VEFNRIALAPARGMRGQVLRMSQRLKLACLLRVQAGKGFFRQGLLQDTRPEIAAGCKNLRSASRRPRQFFESQKINVRGQVLFARVRQQIVADVVAMIGASVPRVP